MSSGHRETTLSDIDFIRMFEKEGPGLMAKKLGLTERGIQKRRAALEDRHKVTIRAPRENIKNPFVELSRPQEYPHRVEVSVKNGVVIVGSDGHIWPGEQSTATRAFIKFIKELKPQAVILNGDVIDAGSISRHPPIGWESQPTIQEEIEAAQDTLHEIALAAGKARKVWTLGNHDARFETRLATVAPEYAMIAGVHLKDHFPAWETSWSVFVNNNTVIKHRFKGGIHAPHNNTMWAGRSIVTGHLHSAKVYPLTDYNGTRYGVDTGCLADTMHKAFIDYTEDNARNWRSAFCVLTYHQGELLMPELVQVWDRSHVQWRGTLVKV